MSFSCFTLRHWQAIRTQSSPPRLTERLRLEPAYLADLIWTPLFPVLNTAALTTLAPWSSEHAKITSTFGSFQQLFVPPPPMITSNAISLERSSVSTLEEIPLRNVVLFYSVHIITLWKYLVHLFALVRLVHCCFSSVCTRTRHTEGAVVYAEWKTESTPIPKLRRK